MEIIFDVNPAVRWFELLGLLEIVEMQRFGQVAGQFVETILLPIMGTQDV